MAHPFVPTFLLVWALSMVVRSCAVPAATLPPERQAVQPADSTVTESQPALAPGMPGWALRQGPGPGSSPASQPLARGMQLDFTPETSIRV